MKVLNVASDLPETVCGREDDFSASKIGIVHFGVGAFHRAHQAVYIHDVLAREGGDWKILGVSLQSTHIADGLNAQDGHYTIVIRESDQPRLQMIKSIAHVEAAVAGTDQVFKTLASPDTRIVSMTVTEKAYGIHRQSGKVNKDHPAIAHDLENPHEPIGILGFIVKGLKLRKAKGLKPFTVLCCDNLSQNGDLVQGGVIDFATRIGETDLADWIDREGAFPNAMVDRITPATTPSLIEEVSKQLGFIDHLPVETEPFSQWILEDKFVCGRPGWESSGVIMVEDVAPYEEMKLRMLNGAHSLIAYMGFLSQKQYVRDVMADAVMADLVAQHIKAAAKTLKPLSGLNLPEYGKELIRRFKNPNIAHETFQIAMDGSQKMPQRIFQPALASLQNGHSIGSFAFVTAAWLRFCSGLDESGEAFLVNDPRSRELTETFAAGNGNAARICDGFCDLDDLFPKELAASKEWREAVSKYLALLLDKGIKAGIEAASKQDGLR